MIPVGASAIPATWEASSLVSSHERPSIDVQTAAVGSSLYSPIVPAMT